MTTMAMAWQSATHHFKIALRQLSYVDRKIKLNPGFFYKNRSSWTLEDIKEYEAKNLDNFFSIDITHIYNFKPEGLNPKTFQ